MSTEAKQAPRTLLEFLQVTATFLAGRGIEGARLDAELMLGEVLGLTRTQLYTNFERPLAAGEVDRFRELVKRRANREPVAYILGRREFWSMDLAVDRRVLVPRPETELLVEIVLDALKARGVAAPRVADVGTGSGAIAIAIAKEMPEAHVVASDRSGAALEVAPANAARHGVEARIEFVSGDGCAALAGKGPFDAIASNPPYIRSAEMATLPPDVREWEPRWALESGAEGMDVTAPLIEQAFDLLVPGGTLAIEVGTQSGPVRDGFVKRGYESVAVRRDLAGQERVVVGRRPE